MSEEQHVIELDDDFELNAKAAEDAAAKAEPQDDQTETPADEGESPEVKEEGETPNEDPDGSSDEGEPDAGDDQGADQKKIDSIVSSRLKQQSTKHELAMEQERQERLILQKQFDDLQAHNLSEQQRQSELNKAIDEDGLVDDSVKNLAKPNEYKAPVHNVGVTRFAVEDQRSLQIDATELDIKMQEEWGDSYKINAMKIGHAIERGVVHSGVLSLANKHENGTKLLDAILNDDSVYNELALAGYQSNDFAEYALKFNELASKIKPNSESVSKNVLKKAKPEPNKTLKQAPSIPNTDDDTVYID